jgi:NADH-quinone oxidoreductase subunit A
MEYALLPILLFAAGATALSCGMLAVSSLFGPKRQTAVKQMPYESGMDPIHDAHRRFDVRFHLVAIAFLVFDVELLFLYPWAVVNHRPDGIAAAVAEAADLSQQLGHPIGFSRGLVFGEVMVFIGLLAVGLAYAWRKGVFQWR